MSITFHFLSTCQDRQSEHTVDIISSINSAFTQVQRFQQLSVGSSEGQNRSQVGFRERESVSHSSNPFRGQQALSSGNSGTPAPNNLQSAVQNAIAYDRSESGGLQLRTQEGDVVRIKFMNSESMNAQNQQFESGGTVISDFSLSNSSSSSFKVVVDGDLNGEELSAIRDVLVQAREMANTFYDGDVKEAFSIAADFSYNSEQLSNVNMKFNLRESFTYARPVMESTNPVPSVPSPGETTQPVAPVVNSEPPAAPTSVQTPPADLSAEVSQPDTAAVAPVAAEPEANSISQEGAPVAVETPTLVHAAPDPTGSLAGALSTINDFLSQLTESLNAFGSQFQSPGNSSAFSFTGGFQLQIVSAMVSQIETSSVEKPFAGHELAAATLNEVALKMDAQVEDVA